MPKSNAFASPSCTNNTGCAIGPENPLPDEQNASDGIKPLAFKPERENPFTAKFFRSKVIA
ncbi:hypothetical protein NBRC116590_32100 [Pelagimonas sp. KU-00592-HH]